VLEELGSDLGQRRGARRIDSDPEIRPGHGPADEGLVVIDPGAFAVNVLPVTAPSAIEPTVFVAVTAPVPAFSARLPPLIWPVEFKLIAPPFVAMEIVAGEATFWIVGAVRETAPPLVVMPAPRSRRFDTALLSASGSGSAGVAYVPTVAVSDCPAVVSAIGSLMRMYRDAWSVTLPLIAASVAGETVAALLGKSAGMEVAELMIVEFSPPPANTYRSSGSSSRLPSAPFGAPRLAPPSKTSPCLPETSAKPPLPPAGPPCALSEP